MIPIRGSSLLAGCGYDGPRQLLALHFKASGRVRIYRKVPAAIFQNLMAAPSAGRFYNTNIKGKFSRQPKQQPAVGARPGPVRPRSGWRSMPFMIGANHQPGRKPPQPVAHEICKAGGAW